MIRAETTTRGASFLDMQAAVGITKHPGGYAASDELLALCHIEQAREVLNVGCGIGVGSIYIAKKFGCHVVGIDHSPQMIAWSRQRAGEEGVASQVDFQVADLLALPFVADHFDLVFCESVLNFVADKPCAITELVRVTKPGGYLGINEMFWLAEAPVAFIPQVQAILGTDQPLPTAAAWQALWEASGLCERVVRIHPVDPRQEVKDRIQWIGWRWMVRAWGRALRLYMTNPAVRQAIKEQLGFPLDVMQQMGYGLFVGRK
ncbi:MAG TPA: class I SAM-dependent methyltransferase [Caldilineaceae bacterium]|nr:class I SAM-dependent methyltransferase [Caldilineaceae bacterium]